MLLRRLQLVVIGRVCGHTGRALSRAVPGSIAADDKALLVGKLAGRRVVGAVDLARRHVVSMAAA